MDRIIPLTQGFAATIDAKDFHLVYDRKWRVKRNGSTNYAISDSRGIREWMHRVILNCALPVDHIDGDGLNNRRSNLRLLDNTNNIRRKRPNRNGTSKFKGVSKFRESMWQVSIKVDGKSKWLGSFNDEEVAAKIYDAAARYYFGEHAYQNFK